MRNFRGIFLLILMFCVWVPPVEADPQTRLPERLRQLAAERGKVRVLVRLNEATLPEGRLRSHAARLAQRRRIIEARTGLMRELRHTPHRRAREFGALPLVALEVSPEGLDALARSARVLAVEEDRLARPLLAESAALVQADELASTGFDGSGQVVVLLDTGVDGQHPNLQGKLVAEACFASGTPFGSGDCPDGESTMLGLGAGVPCGYGGNCFHGTHVAGIAVGSGSQNSGIAPAAKLISIQVFSEFENGACGNDPSPCPLSYTSDQIAGLDHVYEVLRHQHEIAVVNMSLGSGSFSSPVQCDVTNASIKEAIQNLRSVGIATVSSAGNESSPDSMSTPACVSPAVSVGATDDVDQVAGFSNSASFLSLWAPGKNIRAPLYNSTGFKTTSGTSMAAPHVSAGFALMRQAKPDASVDEMITALKSTALPIEDDEAHTGRVRLRWAVEQLLHGPACNDGLDNDSDGLTDFPMDPSCLDPTGLVESSPEYPCDDDRDNDGDGLRDTADPGCHQPYWPLENPACNDGEDNDEDGDIDEDDASCEDAPYALSERCGLGFELSLLLVPLFWLRARRRAQFLSASSRA